MMNLQKSRPPKGLILLSLIIVVGSLSAVRCVTRPDGHMIYAGQILQGLPFKIYYSAFAGVNLAVGIGLLLRRRWSYVCFLTVSAYSLLLAVTNIIVTPNEKLILAGWKHAGDGLTILRLFQIGVICVVGLMALWLYRYRGEVEKPC